MQTTDTSLSLVPKRRILGRRLRLTTRQDPDHPTPTFLPVASGLRPAARRPDRWDSADLADRSAVQYADHGTLLGGAVAADTPEHGVVDRDHRVFGYQNLFVCDGAVIPANPGGIRA